MEAGSEKVRARSILGLNEGGFDGLSTQTIVKDCNVKGNAEISHSLLLDSKDEVNNDLGNLSIIITAGRKAFQWQE